MKLTVNDMPYDYSGEATVQALLVDMGADPKTSAVMVQGTVVPSRDWCRQDLNEGDRVEVLVFAGGG